MKQVQVEHSWRSITSAWEGKHTFASISTKSTNGFTQSSVALAGGLLVLAGINSSGKTRLLKSIWSEIHAPTESYTSVEWQGAPPEKYSYVDMFELLNRQWASHRAVDIDEQLEAAGFAPFRSKQIRNTSYLLGREYEAVKIAELEAVEAGDGTGTFRDDVVPYFEVRSSGRTYTSKQLSKGELSALTLQWVLNTATDDTVLLFDEPDLMLSARSARRALDLIVDHANTKKMPTVVSTHAYLSLAGTPRAAQTFLRVSASGESSLERPDDLALWDALRVSAPKQYVFVVEDEMARSLLWALLSLVEFSHVDATDIWVGGDAAKVRAFGRLVTPKDATMSIWGVLDGNETISDKEPKCLKLPWNFAPEDGALAICATHPTLVTDQEESLQRALDRTVGDNPHDRVHHVAHSIGMSGATLVLSAWTEWLKKTATGANELEAFRVSVSAVTPPSASAHSSTGNPLG